MIDKIFYGLTKTIESYEHYNITPLQTGKLLLFSLVLSYSMLVFAFGGLL